MVASQEYTCVKLEIRGRKPEIRKQPHNGKNRYGKKRYPGGCMDVWILSEIRERVKRGELLSRPTATRVWGEPCAPPGTSRHSFFLLFCHVAAVVGDRGLVRSEGGGTKDGGMSTDKPAPRQSLAFVK